VHVIKNNDTFNVGVAMKDSLPPSLQNYITTDGLNVTTGHL